MTCQRAFKAPRCRRTKVFFWFTQEPQHKGTRSGNLTHKELTFTRHTQSVVRAKDMNTKLLDGLEMFLGVFVTSLNSNKLQMAGGCHIYRPPSRTSRLEPLPNFLRMHQCIRKYRTGASGHSELQGIRWGSDSVTQEAPDKPMAWCRFIRCSLDHPVLKGSSAVC